MSKRKVNDDDGSGSDSDVSFVDVDFDFFDPNPTVDYHALKRLLAQLFNRDAEHLPLAALVDLVLAQPTVGTTIKTDGLESDPYALLTVLNMHAHRANPAVAALAAYFLDRSAADPPFHAALQALLAAPDAQLGLVLCERLVNMPVQTVPPMYRMLADEIKWAVADAESYAFTHLLFVSRTYHLSPAEEAAAAARAPPAHSKKSKKPKKTALNAGRPPPDGIYPFHPEDACIQEHATHTLSYAFAAAPSEPRDADAFGLDVRGRLILVDAQRWDALVARLGEVYV
ncbi:p21-C-terminal region-binding protein-domain-containing protein [Mycena sp. CBHHK59/15]|nr:p21-C-terminal region-binding protein-domain-containing protein [Mycena sp. CBHHK59/15]